MPNGMSLQICPYFASNPIKLELNCMNMCISDSWLERQVQQIPWLRWSSLVATSAGDEHCTIQNVDHILYPVWHKQINKIYS